MRISANAFKQAMAHCAASLPDEACGVFLGQQDLITAFYPLRNVSREPRTSFAVDPEEWIPLIYAPDKPIMGLLHSHPDSAADPSEADHQLYWPDLPSYWIASFQKPHAPKLCCYRIERALVTTGAPVLFQSIAYSIVT